ERVAAIVCGRALPVWEQQHLPKLQGVSNLTVLRFDQPFINNLAARLDRSITWSVTVNDGNLYINVGADSFETLLHELTGHR
ncbi:MAG: YaeQ family protein, partial [Desulfuromonadaceae bacterium]